MGNVTKNQHYVWKYYLSAWTNNGMLTGKVAVHRKEQAFTLDKSSLEKLASSNYTYCYSEVTAADIEFIDAYIQGIDTKFDIIKPYIQRITTVLKNHSGDNDFFEKELVCKIENAGMPFLERLRAGDISCVPENPVTTYINKQRKQLFQALLGQESIPKVSTDVMRKVIECDYDDSLFDFYHFMMFQFFRTRKTKIANKNALESLKECNPKYVAINSDTIFMATLMIDSFIWANMLLNKDFKVILINNDTNEPFIVSDAPILNLDADPDGKVQPENLRLFYPITPKLAIIVAESDYVPNTHLDVGEVEYLNTLVYKHAFNEVYAIERSTLDKYIQ